MANTRILLDPWPAEYESPIQIEDAEEDGAAAAVDTSVEDAAWKAVGPSLKERPETIYFVDGVRRVEARIILDDGSGRLIRGLFGSVGVGAVKVQNNKAEFEEIRILRNIISGSGVAPETRRVGVGNGEITFLPASVEDSDPAAPLRRLQNVMRDEEAMLAQTLAATADCVFADGPLSYFVLTEIPAIGIVKRLFRPYLPIEQFGLVGRLKAGERTPIFSIDDGKYDRYSWYLRVAEPRAMDHSLAGMLRLEVRKGLGLAKAIELADMSAACIPAFVAESFRDPRSPQNLLPVGALERELRHRLGDPMAIRRAIESNLYGK
ncbi:MAG: hypothetical protein ACREDR_01450 [Blastocatellia bacterium]